MVNYVNPSRNCTFDNQDGSLSYFNTEDNEGQQEHRQGHSQWHGGRSGRGSHYPRGRGLFHHDLHESYSVHDQQPGYEDVEGDDNNISHNVAHYSSTVSVVCWHICIASMTTASQVDFVG
jgi:hypothetical protein